MQGQHQHTNPFLPHSTTSHNRNHPLHRTQSLDTATLRIEHQTQALDALYSSWEFSAHQLSSDALHSSSKIRKDSEIRDFLDAVQRYDQVLWEMRFRFGGFGGLESENDWSRDSVGWWGGFSSPPTTTAAAAAAAAAAVVVRGVDGNGAGFGAGGERQGTRKGEVNHPLQPQSQSQPQPQSTYTPLLPHNLHLIPTSLQKAHTALASASWRIARYASLSIAATYASLLPSSQPSTSQLTQPSPAQAWSNANELVYSTELGGRWVRRGALDAEVACHRFWETCVSGRIRGCTAVLRGEARVLEEKALLTILEDVAGTVGGVGVGAGDEKGGDGKDDGDWDGGKEGGNQDRRGNDNDDKKRWWRRWYNTTHGRTRGPRHKATYPTPSPSKADVEDYMMSGALLPPHQQDNPTPIPTPTKSSQLRRLRRRTSSSSTTHTNPPAHKKGSQKKKTPCQVTTRYPRLPLLAYQAFKLVDKVLHHLRPEWTEKTARWMLDRVLVIDQKSAESSGISLLRLKVETKVLMVRREEAGTGERGVGSGEEDGEEGNGETGR